MQEILAYSVVWSLTRKSAPIAAHNHHNIKSDIGIGPMSRGMSQRCSDRYALEYLSWHFWRGGIFIFLKK